MKKVGKFCSNIIDQQTNGVSGTWSIYMESHYIMGYSGVQRLSSTALPTLLEPVPYSCVGWGSATRCGLDCHNHNRPFPRVGWEGPPVGAGTALRGVMAGSCHCRDGAAHAADERCGHVALGRLRCASYCSAPVRCCAYRGTAALLRIHLSSLHSGIPSARDICALLDPAVRPREHVRLPCLIEPLASRAECASSHSQTL